MKNRRAHRGSADAPLDGDSRRGISDMAQDFQTIVDKLPTSVKLTYARAEWHEDSREDDPEASPKKVVVVLSFSEKGFGFGEVAIIQTDEGVFIDTEHMTMERVKWYFNALLDQGITDMDMDPERHALYNKVNRRTCGDGCTVCNPKT
jgi:hypothetical protein